MCNSRALWQFHEMHESSYVHRLVSSRDCWKAITPAFVQLWCLLLVSIIIILFAAMNVGLILHPCDFCWPDRTVTFASTTSRCNLTWKPGSIAWMVPIKAKQRRCAWSPFHTLARTVASAFRGPNCYRRMWSCGASSCLLAWPGVIPCPK
jgi:hypothetical protein